MSKQTINIGASPNDGTGTPLRTSFDYTNQNFTELYTALGGGVGLPGATTQVIFNDGGTNLAGDAGLVYNKTTDALTVAGLVTAGSAAITGAATVGTTFAVGTVTPDIFGRFYTRSIGFDSSGTTALQINGTSYSGVDLGAAGVRTFGITASGTDANISTVTNIPMLFGINNTEAMRLNSTANLVLKGGTVAANGVGVTFPATQVASSDANCLDDYEEGTFTPTVFGSTVAGIGVYSAQGGFYTKVGNIVTVQVYLIWSALAGATGDLRFGGLPFAASASTNAISAASIGYANNITLTASNVLTIFNSGTNTFVQAYQYPVGGGASTIVPVALSGGIIYSITYRV
jgi:hypothetical protein